MLWLLNPVMTDDGCDVCDKIPKGVRTAKDLGEFRIKYVSIL